MQLRQAMKSAAVAYTLMLKCLYVYGIDKEHTCPLGTQLMITFSDKSGVKLDKISYILINFCYNAVQCSIDWTTYKCAIPAYSDWEIQDAKMLKVLKELQVIDRIILYMSHTPGTFILSSLLDVSLWMSGLLLGISSVNSPMTSCVFASWATLSGHNTFGLYCTI